MFVRFHEWDAADLMDRRPDSLVNGRWYGNYEGDNGPHPWDAHPRGFLSLGAPTREELMYVMRHDVRDDPDDGDSEVTPSEFDDGSSDSMEMNWASDEEGEQKAKEEDDKGGEEGVMVEAPDSGSELSSEE